VINPGVVFGLLFCWIYDFFGFREGKMKMNLEGREKR